MSEIPPSLPGLHEFPEIRRQVWEAEGRMADLALRIELSNVTAHLLADPGWRQMCDRFRTIMDADIEKLISTRSDDYWTGRRQGRISTMRLLIEQKTLTAQEVDTIRAEMQDTAERLAHFRSLLQ